MAHGPILLSILKTVPSKAKLLIVIGLFTTIFEKKSQREMTVFFSWRARF